MGFELITSCKVAMIVAAKDVTACGHPPGFRIL
jgi:hypothetical protein